MSPSFSRREILLATAGVTLGVAAVAGLASHWQGALLLGSFGASALLIFALPEVPYAQPRAVLLGHLLASLLAWVSLHTLGPGIWPCALATGLAVGAMMVTRSVHPPAASNGIIVFFAKPSLTMLLASTALGCLTLVLVGLAYHQTTRPARYPRYWWRPESQGGW